MDLLVSDDHWWFAEALTGALESHGHRVLATVSRPPEVVGVIETRPVDAVLVTIRALDAPTTAALERLCHHEPRVRIVVLSDELNELEASTIAQLGGEFADTRHSFHSLVAVLEGRPRGTYAIQPRRHPMPQPRRTSGAWTAADLSRFLTDREREVLAALVRGDSTDQLSRRLGIRPATTRTHVQHLLTKLGVHSRLEAVALAVEHSLVDLDELEGMDALDRAAG